MAYSLTYTYNSTSQSYSVTGYSNIATSDNVVIPSTYDDGTNGAHPVTHIGYQAFANCTSLTSVSIASSVTTIDERAFSGCTSLTDVTIPDSVTSIGNYAFRNCTSLTSVNIPNSVTYLGDKAFRDCSSLTSVIIGNSVTSIGYEAFNICPSLKTIILFPEMPPTLGTNAIPSTVTDIYVQQSSKEAYKTATNWTTLADKIKSDDIYLSFIRFNKKNKEYINEKINDNNITIKKYVDDKYSDTVSFFVGEDGLMHYKVL